LDRLKRYFQTGKEWLINVNKKEGNILSKFFSNKNKTSTNFLTNRYTMIMTYLLNFKSITSKNWMMRMKITSFYNQQLWNIWKINRQISFSMKKNRSKLTEKLLKTEKSDLTFIQNFSISCLLVHKMLLRLEIKL